MDPDPDPRHPGTDPGSATLVFIFIELFIGNVGYQMPPQLSDGGRKNANFPLLRRVRGNPPSQK